MLEADDNVTGGYSASRLVAKRLLGVFEVSGPLTIQGAGAQPRGATRPR